MWRAAFSLLVLVFALASGRVRAAEKWSRLKLGMSAEETIATLGSPTLRTAGRGFEIWIYDNGAEVLLFGSVIGWTVPTSAPGRVRSIDVWQQSHNGTYFPTFLSRLPVPIATRWIPRTDDSRSNKNGGGYWAPFYLYRR